MGKTNKLNWRFRKGSEADPIKTLECGCKIYVYDKTVVRHCEAHKPAIVEGMVYESKESIGKCIKCGKEEDLRHGLCFTCAGNTTEEEYKKLKELN